MIYIVRDRHSKTTEATIQYYKKRLLINKYI